jgi:hypothetical protein
VRDLGPFDVRRLFDHIGPEHTRRRAGSKDKPIRASEVSPATLAKHLRQLGACFEAASGKRHGVRPRRSASPELACGIRVGRSFPALRAAFPATAP